MLAIFTSPKTAFRYSALFEKKIYYFGHPNMLTYIDGVSPDIRYKYIRFTMKDKYKCEKIQNLVPSRSMFEYYVLWGHSQNIDTNIDHVNSLLCKKYKNIDYFY